MRDPQTTQTVSEPSDSMPSNVRVRSSKQDDSPGGSEALPSAVRDQLQIPSIYNGAELPAKSGLRMVPPKLAERPVGNLEVQGSQLRHAHRSMRSYTAMTCWHLMRGLAMDCSELPKCPEKLAHHLVCE